MEVLKNKRRVVSYVTCSDLFFFVRVLWPPFPLLTSSVHVLVSLSLKLRTDVWQQISIPHEKRV